MSRAPGDARSRPLAPKEILALPPEGADELLDRLEETVPQRGRFVDSGWPPATEAVVFGDTHGDWRSTEAAAERFLTDPAGKLFIGLGDYIDRAPDDCGAGSVANALYLLGLAASHPTRVFLIQGNHETTRRLPVLPHELAEQVDELWGPEVERYARLLSLLERGALAAQLPSGVYLAHGGFPRGRSRESGPLVIGDSDDDLAEIVWGDCGASRLARGVVEPFTSLDLERFLESIQATMFLRGHDPDLNGRRVFHDRCLTLHTSRAFERMGGVLVAHVPLSGRITSASSVGIEHLETEGRSFPPVD